MNLLKKFIIFFTVFFIAFYSKCLAEINLSVSPIKYEIESSTWSTIIKTAKLINLSDQSFTIYTWKSDFTSKDSSWNPKFVRKSELVFPEQQLSSWITIDTKEFNIWPWEEKEISFTIKIPENATPGWHYWAIFFKNNNSENSVWSQVGINIDYWVLILLKVDWEVVTKWEIEEEEIKINTGWWGWWSGWWTPSSSEKIVSKFENEKETQENLIDDKKDNCFIDLTKSNYDWKCIGSIIEDKEENLIDDKKEENVFDKDKGFNIIFDIPFKNEWNTHIKPEGTIKLIDENWNELKQIWKEVIKNDAWSIIWEKIVDYIPINDVWWNVLPSSKREFKSEWKGFPYKSYDNEWNQVLNYWSPWEYYTKRNIEKRSFLMFWERVAERQKNETIKALINLSYEDENWEDIEFNSAKEFKINYIEEYIQLNPYVIISIISIFIVTFLFWIIWLKRKKKCKGCWKRIRKDLKICPYCLKKQKK